MKMKRLAVFLIGAAFVALSAACDNTANDNVSNANMANTNRAVNMNTNANANMNANANTRASYNANISKEEYEKDKERYGREAKGAGETVGQGLEDGWLWVKTKGALAAVDDLRDSTINVDLNNAVVTLRGTVANAAQKTKAEATAKGIKGVTSVKDELKVAPNDSVTNMSGNSNNSNKANTNAHK
jgi:hyperosmotically inducible protein